MAIYPVYKILGGGYSYPLNGDHEVPGNGFTHLQAGVKRGISKYYS